MVKERGKRLSKLSVHSWRNSSLCTFFITKERRKGDIISTVSEPHKALPGQCPSAVLHIGSAKVNINTTTAVERIPYIIVLTAIFLSRIFHVFSSSLEF